MKAGKGAKLIEGDISKTILSLTLPMMIGMVGMVIFNLIDTYFIGQLGTKYLAAMSFTLPVIMFVTSIALGLGVGVSSVVSRMIGKGDKLIVQRRTTDGLILSFIVVTFFVIIGYLVMIPIFKAMGATKEMLPLILDYMKVWIWGVPFVVIPMAGNGAIRAAGNTIIPSVVMLISIIVNTVLDPILIFGLGPFERMELEGAAIATVAARATTFVFSLLFLKFKFNLLTAKIPTLKELLESWKNILSIAIPAGITQLIFPVSIGVITKLISKYGENGVAALGVAGRVEMFALSPLFALGAVMVPFVGQNLGAKKFKRIDQGLKYSYKFSLISGTILYIVVFIFGKHFAGVFDKNPIVIDLVSQYLKIVALSYGFQGFIIIVASSFNGMNHPFYATAVNLLRMFGLYIPIAYIADYFWGIKGIFIGASLSSFIAGAVAIFWINLKTKKLIKKHCI